MKDIAALGPFSAPSLLVLGAIIFVLLAGLGKVPGRTVIELTIKQRRFFAGLAAASLLLFLIVSWWLVEPCPAPVSTQIAGEVPCATHVPPIQPSPTLEFAATVSPTPISPEEAEVTPEPELAVEAETPGPQVDLPPTPVQCVGSFPGASDVAPSWRYVAKNGETLEDIVASFRPYFSHAEVTWQHICEENTAVVGGDCMSPDRVPEIRSGQVLRIPDVSAPITYEVAKSDSLVRIAAQFFGKFHDNSEPLWVRIYCDNMEIIGFDHSRLNPGQQLEIHPLKWVQLPEYAVRPGDTLSALARAFYDDETMKNALCSSMTEQGHEDCWRLVPHQILELSPVPEGRPYVIQPGDTLESIAEGCYGTSAKAGQVHLANRPVLGDDPCCVHPGQQIILYSCTIAPQATEGS